MPSANDPAPPTSPAAVQAIPPGPPAVKLPPQPRPDVTPEDQARGIIRLDAAVVALVLVLAFLLASFAVRNSDFWMHLATGRALVQGHYNPLAGQDPFSYTTAGAFWTNPNWLYDLLLYAAYQALGGPALVVLKALAVVLLAVVLLQTRRPGQSVWVPAVCTGLAILALGPRLYLQPTVISFLFVALTLWYLERANRAPAAGEAAGRAAPAWWLPVLFLVWANLDGWFLLGLLAVALYVVGDLLDGLRQPAGEPARGRVRRLALVLGLSAAACLLNPSFYRVFLDWPMELSFRSPVSLLAQDSEFRGFFVSPFDPMYWHNTGLGHNAAGLAFLALILVGVVSFAVNLRAWRWSRALTWLAFFVLAALRHPAVSFFAVVAGPIAALNFQDALARRGADRPVGARARLGWAPVVWSVVLAALVVVTAHLLTTDAAWRIIGPRLKLEDLPARLNFPGLPLPFLVFAGVVLALLFYALGTGLAVLDRTVTSWSLGGRLLTALAGVALLVLAWPGWLQASWSDPYHARHVAWSLEPDASYEEVAAFLGRLRQQGAIAPDDRGFAVTPQVMNYCAWTCPEEKGFFDMRFTPFPGAAPTFLALRDTLRVPENEKPEAGLSVRVWPADENAANRLRDTFRQNHITHVILGEREPAGALNRIVPLWNNRQEWVLIYLDGRTAVFGWQDPAATGAAQTRWEPLRYDRDRLAFGPPAAAEPAPAEGPGDGKLFAGLTTYTKGTAPRSLKLDEAALDLGLFGKTGPLWRRENVTVWATGYAAGMVGSACPTPDPLAMPSLLAYQACLAGAVFGPSDEGGAQRSPAVDGVVEAMERDFIVRHDSGPPAFALLAVRAARGAIAQTPRDAYAYLALENAYRTLHYQTREIAWEDQLPALTFLRHVQMVTALNRALEQDPGLAGAEAELVQRYLHFRRYGQPGFLDVALHHAREQLRLLKEGRPAQQAEKDYREDLSNLEKAVKALQQQVTDKQNQYEVRAASLPVLQKAQLALSLGLPEQALNVLLESEVLLFGPEGARLELELLLTMGRTREARRMLFDPVADLEASLGSASLGPYNQVPALQWYRLVLAAADGDYGKVDDGFSALLQGTAERLSPDARLRLAEVVAWNLMFTPQAQTAGSLFLAQQVRTRALQEMAAMAMAAQQDAELQVYRGLFALEAGDTTLAASCFRRALPVGDPPNRFVPYLAPLGAASPLEGAALTAPAAFAAEGPAIDFPGREAAVHYLGLIDDEATAPRRTP